MSPSQRLSCSPEALKNSCTSAPFLHCCQAPFQALLLLQRPHPSLADLKTAPCLHPNTTVIPAAFTAPFKDEPNTLTAPHLYPNTAATPAAPETTMPTANAIVCSAFTCHACRSLSMASCTFCTSNSLRGPLC
uniref:Uncharacterized protein n=1 Tax=Dunaliella tertiolecta TaxID=3047 RepID=A0A7S3VKP1_DUNTE